MERYKLLSLPSFLSVICRMGHGGNSAPGSPVALFFSLFSLDHRPLLRSCLDRGKPSKILDPDDLFLLGGIRDRRLAISNRSVFGDMMGIFSSISPVLMESPADKTVSSEKERMLVEMFSFPKFLTVARRTGRDGRSLSSVVALVLFSFFSLDHRQLLLSFFNLEIITAISNVDFGEDGSCFELSSDSFPETSE